MPAIRHKSQPVRRISNDPSRPSQIIIRNALQRHDEELALLPSDLFGTTTVVNLPTPKPYAWAANGPYQVGTAVDGARVINDAMSIASIWLYRTTPGSSGSTILDLNLNGTSLYAANPGNRPTIAFNDADNLVAVTLPNVVAVAAGGILTVDTDQIEAGSPEDWVLMLTGT